VKEGKYGQRTLYMCMKIEPWNVFNETRGYGGVGESN
jgi:hypothetical protein